MTSNTRKLALLLPCLLSSLAFGQSSKATHKAELKAEKVTSKGHRFSVVSAHWPGTPIAMYWKSRDGTKMKSFTALENEAGTRGHHLLFATNAGMFTETNDPCGLYVEHGNKLRPLVKRTSGAGNFFIQPNGVFLLTQTGAHVVTTAAVATYDRKILYATQSGPMLVTDGVINSHFTDGSSNLNIRSGVGTDGKGNVFFAISEDLVNFYDFALLFRDALHCSNALYLDGAISMMYCPQIGLTDAGGNFGAMIGIEE